MEQITVEVGTAADKELLLALLPKLNARVVQSAESQPATNAAFVDVAEAIAARGGVGESFGDPSEWQREIRSWDRVLDGREE